MNYVLFIARRLHGYKGDAQGVSHPAIRIATAGVAVGLAVMLISICVVLGFKGEIRSKVVGFGSHIQVMNYESLYAMETKPIVVNDSLMKLLAEVPNVRHVQRFCLKTGMLKTDESFKGVQLRGVGPEFDSTFIKKHLVEGTLPAFSDRKASNEILISQQIADELHLSVGSKVFAYFFDNSVRARRFTVTGIYRTNLTEFDNALVFTDLYTCNKLNSWQSDQCSGAEVQLNDFDRLDETSLQIINLVNRHTDAYGASYTSPTIKELYPQIFAWLGLLDTNVWVILILMIAVAGFTMVSGLLIIILERTNFIGIMKALGASNTAIRHIFLYFSVFVIGKGLLWGNIIGIGLVLAQRYFGLIHLDAATYYVDTVPVYIHVGYLVAINAATLVISTAVLILPSFLISRIRPATSIRFE